MLGENTKNRIHLIIYNLKKKYIGAYFFMGVMVLVTALQTVYACLAGTGQTKAVCNVMKIGDNMRLLQFWTLLLLFWGAAHMVFDKKQNMYPATRGNRVLAHIVADYLVLLLMIIVNVVTYVLPWCIANFIGVFHPVNTAAMFSWGYLGDGLFKLMMPAVLLYSGVVFFTLLLDWLPVKVTLLLGLLVVAVVALPFFPGINFLAENIMGGFVDSLSPTDDNSNILYGLAAIRYSGLWLIFTGLSVLVCSRQKAWEYHYNQRRIIETLTISVCVLGVGLGMFSFYSESSMSTSAGGVVGLEASCLHKDFKIEGSREQIKASIKDACKSAVTVPKVPQSDGNGLSVLYLYPSSDDQKTLKRLKLTSVVYPKDENSVTVRLYVPSAKINGQFIYKRYLKEMSVKLVNDHLQIVMPKSNMLINILFGTEYYNNHAQWNPVLDLTSKDESSFLSEIAFTVVESDAMEKSLKK